MGESRRSVTTASAAITTTATVATSAGSARTAVATAGVTARAAVAPIVAGCPTRTGAGSAARTSGKHRC
jgi:hypothetical protein